MSDWKVVQLGNAVTQMKTGSTPPTSHSEYFGGDIPWFTPGDIGYSKNLVDSTRTITQDAVSAGEAKLFEKDTLLVTCIGDIGRVGVLQQSSFSNQQITALKFKHDIDSDFAYYWFISNKQKLINLANQAILPILNNERMSEIEFSYPPLTEQKRIASLLARADRLRTLRRTAYDLGESLLQSVFSEMFGDARTNSKNWQKIEAQEIFEIQLGKMLSAREQTGKYLKPYLRNLNVQWGYIDFSDINQMDFDEKEFKRYQLEDGDILVCEGGEVGRTAIYHGEIENCCFQNALHRLRIKKPLIEPLYFLYFMRAAANAGLILEKTSQVTIAHFTAEKFKEFQLLLPPLSLQEEFAGVVARVESLRGRMSEAGRQVEGLFESLLADAFEQ